MALTKINVGTTANDGTGDFIRDAFIKANAGLSFMDRLGALDPYTGVVATGCYQPIGQQGTATYGQSRTPHYASDDITDLQVAYTNSLEALTNGEITSGASVTFEAAVEYPLGTITRITWSGANTVVAAALTDTPLSDKSGVSIPRGALFYMRSGAAGPGGGGVPYRATTLNSLLGSSEFGTSPLTNKIMSGTIGTVNSTKALITPCLIVGTTTRPSIWVVGDSITAGFGEQGGTPDAGGAEGSICRSINPYFGFTASAISGQVIGPLLGAGGALRRARLAYCTTVISAYGTNDLVSASAATFAASVATLKGQVGTRPLFQVLPGPKTTSTDSWATVANQTPVTPYETNRRAFNLSARNGGNRSTIADILDMASVLESTPDSGIWNPAFVYVADGTGTHPNSVGYEAIRQSRVVDPIRLMMLGR